VARHRQDLEALTIGTASTCGGHSLLPGGHQHGESPPRRIGFAILRSLQTLLDQATTGAPSSNLAPARQARLGLQSAAIIRGDAAGEVDSGPAGPSGPLLHAHRRSLGRAGVHCAIAGALNHHRPVRCRRSAFIHTRGHGRAQHVEASSTQLGGSAPISRRAALVDYMNARNDPRRAAYFCLNALGGYGVTTSTSAVNRFHLELRWPARTVRAGRRGSRNVTTPRTS